LTGWTSWGNSVAVTSPVYPGNSYALKSGTKQGGVFQDITSKLTVGATYSLTFEAMLGSSSDQSAEIGIEYLDSSGNVIYDTHAVPSSTAWNPYSLNFTYTSGVTQALVYVWKGSGKSYIYVDNFSVVETGN